MYFIDIDSPNKNEYINKYTKTVFVSGQMSEDRLQKLVLKLE